MMKKNLLLCVLTAAMLSACDSDDENIKDEPTPEPKAVYPLELQTLSGDDFKALFVGKTWMEESFCDVYEDGTLGKNLTIGLMGWSSGILSVLDETTVKQIFLATYMPPTNGNILTNVTTYKYDEKTNKLFFANPAFEKLLKEYVVVSISEEELKLLGDVYSKKLSPNAAYNLYVYKKTGTVTGN